VASQPVYSTAPPLVPSVAVPPSGCTHLPVGTYCNAPLLSILNLWVLVELQPVYITSGVLLLVPALSFGRTHLLKAGFWMRSLRITVGNG